MATLYRKYRSKTFDDVIGQDAIVTTLTNQIKLGRIAHAYLFTGSRGIGKTSCARIFARAVNCLHPVNGNPCGECEVCKSLSSDNVDIIEMDAASNNGVDDARDIREKVKFLPVSCKYKVYIIDEVHMLTGGAFNALLKTIEEPPEHVIFILATTEPQKLPQTILSRCIRFDFKLVSVEELAKHVARIYDAEGVKYTPEAVKEIARLGEGSVRDALSVADAIMSAADLITPEVVLSLTGAGDSSAISALFDSACSRDLKGALAAVDAFAKSGKSMAAVASQLVSYARDALVLKSVGGEAEKNGMVNADKAHSERLACSASKFSLDDISRVLLGFSAAESGLKFSVNPRVFLETAVVKLICERDVEDDLRKRVIALEKKLSVTPVTEQKKNKPIAPSVIPPASAPEPAPAALPSGDPVEFEPPPPPPSDSVPPFQADCRAPEPVARTVEPIGRPVEPVNRAVEAVAYTAEPVDRKSDDFSRAGDTIKPQNEVKVTNADEGEFMHVKGITVGGLKLFGSIATYLRKKGGSGAERARDLLSRGVTVKERDDYIAFVAEGDVFLSLTEKSVTDELNRALDGLGEKRRARIERTEEDIMADDMAHARQLFGRDGVSSRKP